MDRVLSPALPLSLFIPFCTLSHVFFLLHAPSLSSYSQYSNSRIKVEHTTKNILQLQRKQSEKPQTWTDNITLTFGIQIHGPNVLNWNSSLYSIHNCRPSAVKFPPSPWLGCILSPHFSIKTFTSLTLTSAWRPPFLLHLFSLTHTPHHHPRSYPHPKPKVPNQHG